MAPPRDETVLSYVALVCMVVLFAVLMVEALIGG